MRVGIALGSGVAVLVALGCGRFGYDGAGGDAALTEDASIPSSSIGDSVLVTDVDVGLGPPAIAWTGASFVIVWATSKAPSEIHLSEVSADGELLVSDKPFVFDDLVVYGAPDIAADGGDMATTYLREKVPTELWVNPSTLTPSLLLSDPVIKRPSIAAGHGQFAIAVQYTKGILLALVPTGASMPEIFDLIEQPGARAPEIVATSTGYAVAWTDDRSGMSSVYLGFVTVDGALETELLVAAGEGQAGPALTQAGSKVGVAWTYEPVVRAGPGTLRFRAIEVESLEQGDVRTLFEQVEPTPKVSLASSGETFIAASERGDQVAAVSLSETLRASAVLSSEGAVARYPDVAWSGDRYGVAWVETSGTGATRQLRFRIIAP